MAKSKLTLVKSNVSSELLKNPAITDLCREEAQKIMEAAGSDYAMREIKGTKRNSVLVYPTTDKAMYRMWNSGGIQKLVRGVK